MPISESYLRDLASEVASEVGVPGAQVSVLHRGELVESVVGVASVETKVQVTPDTLFQVGSTTKLHTAALVMQLVEEGRIGLDVPVVEQLPGFRLSDAAAMRAVTPRQLMSMSSGIDNGPYTDYGRGDEAVARYVDSLADLPHVFPPGEGFGYSNASTSVSGRLVEHLAGQTWDDALRTRLLGPVGLASSATLTEDIIHRRFAVGHEIDESGEPVPLRQWSYPRSLGPAGGTLCSTASDLVRFGYLFVHSGVSVDGVRVLSRETVAAMQAPQVDVPPILLADWWGLGPYGKCCDGGDLVGHSGTNLGGSSHVLWSVDHDIAVATTVNAARLGYPFASRVFANIFRDCCDVSMPRRPTPPDDVEVDSARFLGRYTMSGLTVTISVDRGILIISASGNSPWRDWAPSPLTPLSRSTFLPNDPLIDGRRGWALAFLGANDEPATRLMNGVFALRRIGH